MNKEDFKSYFWIFAFMVLILLGTKAVEYIIDLPECQSSTSITRQQ